MSAKDRKMSIFKDFLKNAAGGRAEEPVAGICACARDEGLYIEDWVRYHLALGFSKIIIYDNNLPGDDSLPEILREHIKAGRVDVIDARGRTAFQLSAYNECLARYRKELDWLACIDVDEFVTLTPESGCTTIGQYLSAAKAAGADVIYLNWMLFGDNGKTRYEPGPLPGRFPEPTGMDYDGNRHIKSLVSTRAHVSFCDNPHNVVPASRRKAKITDDNFVEIRYNGPWQNISYRKCYLRHYVTKTVEEYVTQKIRRGAPDQPEKLKFQIYNMDAFYRFNERTPEKDRIAESLLERQTPAG